MALSERNPAQSITRLKEDDRKPFRFFSTEEIELLRLVTDLLDRRATRLEIDQAVNSFYREHKDLTPLGPNSCDLFAPRGKALTDRPILDGCRMGVF